MRAISKQLLIRTVAEEWRKAYYSKGGWYNVNREVIYNQLAALNPPTEEAVNAIIGNGAWTSIACHNCHKSVDRVIEMDVTDGDYITIICEDCLRDALLALKLLAE